MKKIIALFLFFGFLCFEAAAYPATPVPSARKMQPAKKTVPAKKVAVKKKALAKSKPSAKAVNPKAELKKLLISKLSRSFSKKNVEEIFSDKRIFLDRSIFTTIDPMCELPDGTKRKYQGYFDPECGTFTRKSLDRGRSFLKNYAADFDAVENKYGVDREIIAAVLRVETNFGAYLGSRSAFNTLYTLYALPPVPSWRDLALEHLEYLLRLKDSNQWADILEVKGSSRGAIGMPQFMPFSYWHYAVDGDGDGKRDLFVPVDSIHSVGNYLLEHSWSDDSADRKKALLSYNFDCMYVQAIMLYAREIKNSPETVSNYDVLKQEAVKNCSKR
ncbi:lytic murein transglycosylase [Candidatus Giovannonibacteria bacterium]|nr:lytic murein transglycosylase [Candidatus Giovannonibacteria bacterium]